MKIASVRRIAAVLCAVLFAASAGATESRTASASSQVLNSTCRVKIEHETGNSIVIGYGSAFGVDLSSYGVQRSRYLLTAAHLVLSDDGSRLLSGKIKVEIPRANRKVWTTCRVLTVTRFYDLCLLECDEDLPVVSKLTLGTTGLGVGSQLLVVGCPLGVSPQVSTGTLTNKEPLVSDRRHRVWEAAAAFNHGNSGGPVFCADGGAVVGVAVAGVRVGGGGPQDMDPSVALFTPYYCVKHFLDVSIAKMAQ